MGNNSKRNITFLPGYLHFAPSDQKATGELHLQEDELESLYLADFKNLYHEACAESLGVSRPTFAKILKSARKKSIEMLMHGKALHIERKQRDFIIAFATNDRVSLHEYFLTARYFAFASVSSFKVTHISYVENPIYKTLEQQGIAIVDDDSAKGMAAGRLIPPLLKEASMLAVASLGEGMHRNIEGMGISIAYTKKRHIDDIVAALES